MDKRKKTLICAFLIALLVHVNLSGQYTNRIRGSVWMKQTPDVTGGSIFWSLPPNPDPIVREGQLGMSPTDLTRRSIVPLGNVWPILLPQT